MFILWVALIVLILVTPQTIDELWVWVRGLSWPLEVLVWVVFLPWMLGLAVWQTDWAEWLRWVIIAVLALGWTAASSPHKH